MTIQCSGKLIKVPIGTKRTRQGFKSRLSLVANEVQSGPFWPGCEMRSTVPFVLIVAGLGYDDLVAV